MFVKNVHGIRCQMKDFSMHPRSSVHRVLRLASQAARSRAVSASSVTVGSYTKLVELPLAVTLH